MSFPNSVTAMILTYNEEPNIARVLEQLKWVPNILVVDSGSTDATLAIVGRYRQARVVQRSFDDFAAQCNFGLGQVTTEWVLSLDADYVLSDELSASLQSLEPEPQTDGYEARFIYRIHGRALRAALYPPRTVLYRRLKARYRNEGHGHRVSIDGRVEALRDPIFHDDRKPLARWLGSQQRYARIEAEHLVATPRAALGMADRIRRSGWAAPPLVFLFTLLVKGCILDGWPGWLYVLQRTLAEVMLAIEIVDRRLRGAAA